MFPTVPVSSIECNQAAWEHRVCVVHNLYIAGNASAAIYVAGDTSFQFPTLRLWEWANRTDPTRPLIPFRKLFHVVSPQEAAALFSQHWSTGPAPAAFALGPHQATGLQAQQPEQRHAGLGGSVAEGGWRFKVVEVAVAVQTFLLNNWWHTMDDVGNTAFRFCKYLKKCSYQELRDTTSSVMFINAQPLDYVPPAARQVFSCFGDVQRLEFVKHLPRERLPQQAQQGVSVVRTALFGVGDEVVHPFHAPTVGKLRANDTMRQRQIDLLRHCAGLPTVSTPRQVPTLRVINREYGSGRTILGVSEALTILERIKPPGMRFSTQLTFPSNLTFAEQAKLFDETDILLIGHGAAAGSMIFLPRTAVVINIGALRTHRLQEESVVQGLPQPFFNATILRLTGEGYTEPMVDKLKSTPAFLELPEEDQSYLLMHCTRSDPRTYGIIKRAFRNWHFAMYYINIRPGEERMALELIRGISLWYGKQVAMSASADLDVSKNVQNSFVVDPRWPANEAAAMQE